MVIKYQKAKRKNSSLFNKKKDNYENNTVDETDSDQAGNNNKPLQVWEEVGKLQATKGIYTLWVMTNLSITIYIQEFSLTGIF